LYEKGLIDKEEFDPLKAKELNIVSVKIDLKKESQKREFYP
jgi:phage pi2 protein 07